MIGFIRQLWAHEAARQIGTAIITAIVTLLLTHAFDSRKLKKQQQITFQDSLGNKIVDAYLKVREVILELRNIEALPESVQYSLEKKKKLKTFCSILHLCQMFKQCLSIA